MKNTTNNVWQQLHKRHKPGAVVTLGRANPMRAKATARYIVHVDGAPLEGVSAVTLAIVRRLVDDGNLEDLGNGSWRFLR